MNTPIRCYSQIKLGVFDAVSNSRFGLGLGFSRQKSTEKGSGCCKEIVQTEGKKVESWPKPFEPAQAWRCSPCCCPTGPAPPNYDPYRIKVPDTIVPPLPPSNAKRTGLVFAAGVTPDGTKHFADDQRRKYPGYHPHQQYPSAQWGQQQPAEAEAPRKTVLDKLKEIIHGQGHEKDNEKHMATGIDFLIYFPMLDCTKARGPCALQPPPLDPPCPPPPRPPFPWIYVWPVALFFTTMGVLYKMFLWKEIRDANVEPSIWRPRMKQKRPYHAKDLPACVQYLIVGAGTAGWSAYQTIKKLDDKAKVFFITKEDIIPYIRPPLSKHMWWNTEPPNLEKLDFIMNCTRFNMYYERCKKFLDPVRFYRKLTGPALSIAYGWCVLRVDAEDHAAYVRTMDGEQPIYYERCLLAPGSKPKNLAIFKTAPKAVRDKVCLFRNIRDLETAYRRVKEAKHITIIGGGILGTELAFYLGRMNKVVERPEGKPPVDIAHVVKDSGLLAGIIPEYLAKWTGEIIKCEGVKILPKTQVYDAFMTDDERLQLTLSTGESLVTDYVFVCIGTEARTEMAKPSFLEVDHKNGGFSVNHELAARNHLYVAGDAASFYSQWKGYHIRMEHYDNAWQEGDIAGQNMTGNWVPCNIEPHYWIRLEQDLQVEVVGEIGACMPTIALFKNCEEDEDTLKEAAKLGPDTRPCYSPPDDYKNRYKRGIIFYLRNEIVVGMTFWNIPPIEDRRDVVTEMLRYRPHYTEIDMLAELVGFPGTKCTVIADEKEIKRDCIKKSAYKTW